MAISRREAKEIVDWVIREMMRRSFPYVTDGKVDLSKTSVGTVSGTATSGGQIANGAIYDRHVHPDADIRGTKIRVATTSEQGVVTLGTEGEALVPTMSGLGSTVSGLGASLVGIFDGQGEFSSDNVEDALHEILEIMGALTFIELADTPSGYTALWTQVGRVPTINEEEAGLEFKPVSYVDGGRVTPFPYDGAVEEDRTSVDGGAVTNNDTIDGGNFVISGAVSLGGAATISGAGSINIYQEGDTIVVEADVPEDFTDLGDTPSSYSGQAKKILAVNSAEDALELVKAFELIALTDDHDWAGITCLGTAGETLAFGQTVYYHTDSKWYKTDATTSGEIVGEVALAVTSGIADASITLLLLGVVKDNSWSWNAGDKLYFSTSDGVMSATAPASTGQMVRRAGYARSSSLVMFRPDGTVITRNGG